MARLRALVTAGGTREPIDDVRVITNRSRGRFGAAIARELVAAGVEVTVLGSSAALALLQGDPVERVPFEAFADLDASLQRLTEDPPDLLFMAAAVSDYTPIRTEGKIRSTTDELTIKLKKTRKLLAGLRERCGVRTFLVGFKLLSRVSRQELIDTAAAQVKKCRLNLTVANDMADFTEALHPVSLVTPEGGAIRVEGPREDVARELVAFVLRRAQVTWSRSTGAGDEAPEADGRERAGELLELAQEAGLLTHGTDGNVSTRSAANSVWTTPRQVDKAALTPADLIHAEVDLDAREVRYRGPRKPSIDTSVHGWLYAHRAELESLVHFHDALLVPTATTAFPYPCGAREEAEEVHAALGAARAPFSVELVDHGQLLGLEPGGVARLRGEWDAARAAYAAHLDAIGETSDDKALTPIFSGASVVGVRARCTQPRPGTSLFLLPEARGGGLGGRLADLLDRAGETAVVHDDCAVLAFYRERGFGPEERHGALTFLGPPSRRDDVVLAASACLYDPQGDRVLLGKRKRAPAEGLWSFPGGRTEPGETDLQAALRELSEETGLRVQALEPALQHTVHVLGTAGSCVRLVCSVIHVQDPGEPVETDELAARWVARTEATGLPLAPGTLRVLRRLPVAQAGPER